MRLGFLAAGVAFAMTLGLAQAHAADDIAFYKGVVTSGYDMTGMFGLPGASLAGDPFTEYFYIDTSKGVDATTGSSTSTFGGSSMGLSAPISAQLTINGRTDTIAGGFYGLARTGYNSLAGRDEISDTAESLSATAMGVSIDYVTSGIYSYDPGVIPDHYDGYDISVNNTNVFQLPSSFLFHTVGFNGADLVDTNGVLDIQSAAPEPSTWALLLAGLAMIGSMLRYGGRNLSIQRADATL